MLFQFRALEIVGIVALCFTSDDAKTLAYQADEKPITIAAQWKKGDTQHYEMIKTRTKKKGDMVTLSGTGRTDFTVEVLEAEEQGFLLKWTWGETKLETAQPATDPLAKKLVDKLTNLIKGKHVLAYVAKNGELKEVRNWKEYKELLEKGLDEILNELPKGAPIPVQQLKTQAMAQFSTQAAITDSFHRDAAPLLFPLGKTCTAAKPTPITVKSRLPDGTSVACQGSCSLKSVNAKHAVLAWEVKNDNAVFPLTQSGEVSVERATGWIESVKQTQSLPNLGQSQVDVTEIRKKVAK